jgi:MFS transporter, DHA2 family, multidrug resistance protein
MISLREKLNWNSPQVFNPKGGLYRWLVLLNITIATTMAIISSVATNVANTTIMGALIMNASDAVWITTGFLLMLGTSLPVGPWLAERFGYKRIYFIGLSIFLFGSCFSGLATNYHVLLVFRLIEGAGGGLLFPICLSIIAQLFPANKRPVAIAAYTGVGFGVGLTLGFLIGGYFAQYVNWQSIFLVNLIPGIPSLFFTWILHQETEAKKGKRFDIWGYICFAIFLVDLLIAVTSAKQPWNTGGWTSSFILTCLTLAGVGLVALLIIESRSDNPIIRLSLFKTQSFTLGCLAIIFVGAVFFGSATYIPIYLENDLHYAKSSIGLILIPFGMVVGVIGSVLGLFSARLNMKVVSVIGLVILAMSCFMNQMITIQSDHAQIILVMVVRSLGVSFSLAPLTTLALSEIPQELSGPASGLITFCRQMGAAFGSATLGDIVVVRQVFHSLMYGSQVQLESPAFQSKVDAYKTLLMTSKGFSSEKASEAARVLIAQNVETQANVSAINDAYFVMGSALVVILALIVVQMLFAYVKKRKQALPQMSECSSSS